MPRLSACCLFFLAPALFLAGRENLLPKVPVPVDPAGIAGALVIPGPGEVSTAALERFFDLAGGVQAKVVVLSAEKNSALVQSLAELAKERQAPAVVLIPLQGPGIPNKAKLIETLNQARGLWLDQVDDFQLANVLAEERIAVLEKFLQRGGVLGASGVISLRLGTALQDGDGPRSKGYDLFPDALLQWTKDESATKDTAKLLQKFPGRVGYSIGPQAALVLQGRTLNVVGPGKVAIHLPSSPQREARTRLLEGKREEDLTALRRAARHRAGPPFPPKANPDPVVDQGTLVIIGGGGTPAGLMKRFVELAGGAKAAIVILPTANPDPLPEKSGLIDVFRKAGAGKVTELRGRTRKEVESKECLDALREATGIWFGGGRQWRFVDAYEYTKAEPLMKDVLRRGGVIGGSSAGATIQGDYLCRGGVFHNFDIMYEGYERGFGYLPGTAIDQHFSQRKRFADMTALMKTHPQLLGIGIDETTALIVQGQIGEVVGKGKVHFYDGRKKVEAGQPDYEAVGAGGRYDLKERRVLGPKNNTQD